MSKRPRIGSASYARVRWFFFLIKFFVTALCVSILGLGGLGIAAAWDKHG